MDSHRTKPSLHSLNLQVFLRATKMTAQELHPFAWVNNGYMEARFLVLIINCFSFRKVVLYKEKCFCQLCHH